MKQFLLLLLTFSFFHTYAESFVSIEGYPTIKESMPDYLDFLQETKIQNPAVNNILYPTLGFSALINGNDPNFSVIIKSESEPSKSFAEVGKEISSDFITFLKLFPISSEKIGENIYRLEFSSEVLLPPSVYSLKIIAPGGEEFFSKNSISYTNSSESVTFTIFADPQIEDFQPKRSSGFNFNNKDYPFYSSSISDFSMQEGIIKASISQMNLTSTDFVVGVGDFVFGINYQREYSRISELLKDLELPFFAVPGNHDGYAKYSDEEDFSSPLEHDGLNYWKSFFGPRYFSFRFKQRVFMMMNTYDGTAERRAGGKPKGIGDYSAVPISNYGGFLSEEQLLWAEISFSESDEIASVFSHHAPIGKPLSDYEFHEQERYPDNSILGVFGDEEWNYETSEYDSNLQDSIFDETDRYNTATRFLKYMADEKTAPYYFSGHTHDDKTFFFESDKEIIPDSSVYASDDIYFVQTCAASAAGGTYWGIRNVSIENDKKFRFNYHCKVENDCIPCEKKDDTPECGNGKSSAMESVPLGNLWATYRWGEGEESIFSGGDAKTEIVSVEIKNSLPTDEKIFLRFSLPALENGFSIDNENYKISETMVSRDKKTLLMTLEGTIKKGTEKDNFFLKAFSSTKNIVTVSPSNDLVEKPETESPDIYKKNLPVKFTVKNSEKFSHLIWIYDERYLYDGEEFNFNPETYESDLSMTLFYIDRKGGWGTADYIVSFSSEDVEIEDDDSNIGQNPDSDRAVSEKLDDNSEGFNNHNDPITSGDGCSCSFLSI